VLRYGRRRRRIPFNAEINITNLVDVAFVLLIIFMITAPILQGGIEVLLPEAEAAPLSQTESIIVSLAESGDIFVGTVQAASLAEFETVFTAVATAGEQRKAVTVRADRRVQWDRLAQVLSLINRAGIADIDLALDPAPPRRAR
jgi:biopolymer transport protein TolR